MPAPYQYLLALVAVIFLSCSSAEETRKQRTVEDVWIVAKKAFDNGEWIEAQTQLELIKLQYPASQYADDAQFLIAEISFERSEYIIAAFGYSMVRRSYPSSEYVRVAMYKTGLCYDKISLPADRDQENTRKAIQAYSDYQAVYMQDSLTREASMRVRDLRDRLAERNWVIAEHYMRTLARKATIAHLDAIIEDFPDSKWLEQAIVLKLEILLFQKKSDDARSLIATYRRSVKDPRMKSEVDKLEQGLP